MAAFLLALIVFSASWLSAPAGKLAASAKSTAAASTARPAASPAASPAAAAATTAASASPSSASTALASGVAAGPTALLDPAASASLDINGKAYALYDAQSGTFLLGRNPDTPLSPASITKVMTVILALERLKLSDVITVTRDMFATIPNDYVRLGLMEGEQITVEETLYACLLISANDAAMALALSMAGSAADFAELMNARARELGCTGTTFTNPYGLADPKNLTTAHDMALIMAEALKSDTYIKFSTTKSHLIPATNKAGTRGLTNGNRFVSTKQYAFADYIGGKTGFTNLSGHTIVAGARRNGRTLVGVILGATASEPRYTNLMNLFSHGFSDYSNIPVDPTAFEPLKTQTLAQVASDIRSAGQHLAVAGSSVRLAPYTTVTAARKSAGFMAVIGTSQAPLQASADSQLLEYPLFAEYKDGARSRVGTLSISLQAVPNTPAASGSGSGAANSAGQNAVGQNTASQASQANGTSTGTLLLRIAGFVLAAILIGVLVIFILMQRELKRRRERRRRLQSRRL